MSMMLTIVSTSASNYATLICHRFGPMVALFRYSSVATYAVSLPPQRLQLSNSIKNDFLRNEIENVNIIFLSC